MNTMTCYQRLVQTIVEDARNGMNFDYEMAAFPGFERRGHSESEFRDWVKTVKWVLNILNTHDGSLNQKKDFCRQSVSAAGVYPCGEGCGYSGGITSSAADGIRVAEAICSAYGG